MFNYSFRVLAIVSILVGIGFGIILKKKLGKDEKIIVRIDVQNLKQKSVLKKHLAKKINLDKD